MLDLACISVSIARNANSGKDPWQHLRLTDTLFQQQPQSIFEHAREAGLIGPPSRYQTPQPSQQQRPMYGMAGALDSHPPTREEDDALLYREHKSECDCPFHTSTAGRDGRAHRGVAGIDIRPGMLP